MNILPRDKRIEIIAALCEGVSIRATERLTGAHRDSVMRLGARVGAGCAKVHDRMMRNVQVPRIELDEAWSFVAKKQVRVTPEDGADVGDQYVYIALAGVAKAIVSYRVGKRNAQNTRAFLADLRERVVGAPEISSDAYNAYPNAVDMAFGLDCTYGTVDKKYAVEAAGRTPEAARRYSPAEVVGVIYQDVVGRPSNISTSYVERQNLSLRMGQKRFSRLSNGFSKRLVNHCMAVALYVAHYNLCRVHEALRVTPAMQLGLTDHVWTIGELVDAALTGDITPEPNKPRQIFERFRVIDGGRS